MLHIERYALLAMLLTWGWIWDFADKVGSYQRLGRAKAFLFAAAAIGAVRVGRAWHWSLGLFFFYIWFRFIQGGLPVHGIMDMVMITATLFLVPILAREISLTTFENTVLITGAVHAVIGHLNASGIYPFLEITNSVYRESELKNSVLGLLGQHTLLSPYLGFSLMIAIHRFTEARGILFQIGYFLLSLLFTSVILLADSSMGFLSLAGGLMVLSIFYLGFLRSLLVAVGIALIAGLAAYHNPILLFANGRLEPWGDAWAIINGHAIQTKAGSFQWPVQPVFGYGSGSWSVVAQQVAKMRGYPIPWIHLHSDLLQALFEWGWAGIALLGIFFFRVLAGAHFLYLFGERRLVPYIAGIAVFGLNGLGNFSLHVIPHGVLLAFCCYVVLKPDRLDEA